jgi:hypothetical protein
MINQRRIVFIAIITFLFLLFIIQLTKSNWNDSSEVYSQAMLNHYSIPVESVATRCAVEGEFYIVESNVYPISIQEDWKEVHTNLPLLQFSTWQNFIQANSTPSRFSSNLHLGCEYNLINQDEINLVNSTACPVRNFSSIGFNEKRNQALVLLNQTCGHTGSGLILLERINGHWKVKDTMSVYIE